MHLRRLEIENFKGVAQFSADFLRPDGSPRPLTMLLGANGSGKTTVLQAIAFVLALATRKIEKPDHFDWSGFLLERIGSRGDTRIALEIGFDDDERMTADQLYRRWTGMTLFDLVPRPKAETPSNTPYLPRLAQITLIYEDGKLDCPDGVEALGLCRGRYFIRSLLGHFPLLRRSFRSVGDVFWFDQNRNLLSPSAERPGIEGLRQYLIGWYAYHASPRRGDAQPDYLKQLEDLFARLFPGASFAGIEPRPGLSAPSPSDAYFLIQREGQTYDLAEMSSGEQAVFPLLYEFVRLEIARSIILIDELELHLHPPQQQSLLASLRRIGPDCQFIMTTHSPYLESAIPDEEEIRLEGGLRCL